MTLEKVIEFGNQNSNTKFTHRYFGDGEYIISKENGNWEDELGFGVILEDWSYISGFTDGWAIISEH